MSEPAKSMAGPVFEMRGVAAVSRQAPETISVEVGDWTVNAGEFWVVGGPQRSGKTDLLMMLGSLIGPAHGEYFFLGERMPIFDDPRLPHRLKLGLVFDGGQLLGRLSIAENIALPLRYHLNLTAEQAESRVVALLELMGLAPWAHRTPSKLAQSWQQRAGLARALVLQPEVLLLDNPLLGLDLRHINWWQRLLSQLSQGHELMGGRPLTLIATTHDLRPWQRFANHVAIVSDRKLQVLGDWSAVTSSRDAVVQELLQEEPASH
jgi:phospholipid/cholesterol/gamma-HCH transport system ATP-binding protein